MIITPFYGDDDLIIKWEINWIICSTPADLLGKLIFRSTLTCQFQGPDEKRFKATCPWLKLEIYQLDGQNLAINETKVFEAIQNLTNVNWLWNVRCLTLLNFCRGKLIFRSTLMGQFQGPDEKRFKATCPWLKLEIYRLDGQNLAINETEVFEAIQNLMNVNRLWNVRRLTLLNFCIGKPWSITPPNYGAQNAPNYSHTCVKIAIYLLKTKFSILFCTQL